jgi:hypothetical protein
MSLFPTDAELCATSRKSLASRPGEVCSFLVTMPKPPIQGEVLGPEERPSYNDPDLAPKDFLRAVYTNGRLPMSVRIDAAKACAAYEHPRLQQVASDITTGVRIIIEGGLPDLPGTNIIMPETETTTKKTNGSGQP